MSDMDNVLYTHFITLAKQALLFIIPCSATDYNLFEEDFPVLQQTTITLGELPCFATDYDLIEDFPALQQTTISSLLCNGLRPL